MDIHTVKQNWKKWWKNWKSEKHEKAGKAAIAAVLMKVWCYKDEQEAETAILEINKYSWWTAQLYQSYFQKQHSQKQNNIEQDATEKQRVIDKVHQRSQK